MGKMGDLARMGNERIFHSIRVGWGFFAATGEKRPLRMLLGEKSWGT